MLFGLRGSVYKNRSCLSVMILPRSTLFLPGIPLPLLEMREAINAKKRDGAVVLVGVM